MTNVRKDDRRRFSLSALAAIVLHCLLIVAFVRFIPLSLMSTPKITGPISVTIGTYEEPAPGAQTAGAQEGQPAEQRAESVPETAAVEKPVPIRSAEESRESSSAQVSETLDSPKRGWELPAPARAQEESDRQKVTKNLAPVPVERTADVAPPKLAAPETVKQSEKKLPFKPETEISETPTALNLQKLDETIGETKRGVGGSDARKTAETAPAQGKAGPSGETGPAAGGTAAAGEAKRGPVGAHGSSGSPVISWEDADVQRALISAAPPPDIPQWVKKEGVDLKVVVSFSVTAGGQTTLVSTALSSGYTDVDSAVLDSVRKMKFNPVPGADLARGTVSYLIRTK
jgi:TonB family protein